MKNKTYWNQGNHLKDGTWIIFGRCRECKEKYIVQTDKKPLYCPLCGKELGELYAIEEEKNGR